MQNLNQIRARHVLAFAEDSLSKKIKGVNGGEVIKKIPTVIMNNGLLAALAFSMDPKNEAWACVFSGVARHLASPEILLVDPSCTCTADLLDFLVSADSNSSVLRNVTAETMAWLEFARRLVQKKEDDR
jgi:hypothetical protein